MTREERLEKALRDIVDADEFCNALESVRAPDEQRKQAFGLLADALDLAREALAAPAEPCTCGSGGHPRECVKHPISFELHCAEISIENMAREMATLEQERDEAIKRAKTAEREVDMQRQNKCLKTELERCRSLLVDVLDGEYRDEAINYLRNCLAMSLTRAQISLLIGLDGRTFSSPRDHASTIVVARALASLGLVALNARGDKARRTWQGTNWLEENGK